MWYECCKFWRKLGNWAQHLLKSPAIRRNGENWKEGVNRWDNQRDTKLGHSRLHKRRPHSRTGPAKASYYYSRSAVISSALLNLRLCQSLENTWLERKSLESMGKCSRASTSFDIKGWPAQGWNRQARQAGRFLKKVDQTLLTTVNMNMTWNRGFGNGCTCTIVCSFVCFAKQTSYLKKLC